MSDMIPPIIVSVEANTSDFEARLARLDSQMSHLGDTVARQQSPFAGLTKTLGALGIAFGAYQIFQFGKGLIDAAEAEQVSNARLENITKSMGLFGAETDKVNSRLEDLAQQTALNTGVDEDSIKATQAKLMTFKNLGQTADEAGGAFDRATQAAIDMAAAGFGEAETNAVQLGKALQDPVKGITALGRAGITFTEQEKEQIASMVKHNDMLGAQQMVLKAIETQVGGTAEATATGSGKMAAAFAHFQETLGLAVLPAVEAMAEGLAGMFNWLSDNLPTIGTFVGVLGGLAIAFNAVSIATWIQTSAFWAMAAALLANPLTWIILGIAALAAGIVWLATKTHFFQDAWAALTKWITSAWTWAVNGISDGITAVVKFFQDLPKNIMTALGDAAKWLWDVGTKIVQGLWNGIQDAWNNFVKWFSDLGAAWLNSVREAFGIHSPSAVFHGFGQNIVQGLIDGIHSKSSELTDTMAGLANTATGSFNASLTASGSISGTYGAGAVAASYIGAGGVSTSTSGASGSSVNINAPVSVHTNANAQDISASIINSIKFNLPYITTGAMA
jgi:hypothetical protein